MKLMGGGFFQMVRKSLMQLRVIKIGWQFGNELWSLFPVSNFFIAPGYYFFSSTPFSYDIKYYQDGFGLDLAVSRPISICDREVQTQIVFIIPCPNPRSLSQPKDRWTGIGHAATVSPW